MRVCERVRPYLVVEVYTTFPIEIQRVFAGKTRVFGVEVGELGEGRTHVAHLAALGVQLPRGEGVRHEGQHAKSQ
jgi:hypothetical protein